MQYTDLVRLFCLVFALGFAVSGCGGSESVVRGPVAVRLDIPTSATDLLLIATRENLPVSHADTCKLGGSSTWGQSTGKKIEFAAAVGHDPYRIYISNPSKNTDWRGTMQLSLNGKGQTYSFDVAFGKTVAVFEIRNGVATRL